MVTPDLDPKWSNPQQIYYYDWADLQNGADNDDVRPPGQGGTAVGNALSRIFRRTNNGVEIFGIDLSGNVFIQGIQKVFPSLPLTIAQGGTGQTALPQAFDALAPTTTRGDMIVRNNAGNNVRLPTGGANLPLIGGNDPSYATPGAVANAVFDALSPATTRGDLTPRGAAGAVRLPIGPANQSLQSDGTDVVWGVPLPSVNPCMSNVTIVESHAANAATFAIKTAAGADPSPADPAVFIFQTTTGTYVVRKVTAALSITIPAGAAMSVGNGQRFMLHLGVFDDAGTVRMGVIQGQYCGGPNRGIFGFVTPYIKDSTAISAASNSSGVWYTGVAVAAKSFVVIGYAEYQSGLVTAGQWAVSPDVLALLRPDMSVPGAPGSGDTWFRDGTGKSIITNLLNVNNVADQNATLNIDTLAANWVPMWAKTLFLNVEISHNGTPAGNGAVAMIRLMADGWNLGNILDLGLAQQYIVNTVGQVGVVGQQFRVPISASRRQFFYAIQSTDAATANKVSIIDCFGYGA